MASKILVDELAPQTGTDVTITATKKIAGANTQYKVTGGSSGQFLTNDGSDGLSWSAAPPVAVKYAVICEQQLPGTSGGTFTNGAWQIRTLNNEIYDDIGVSITANVFTLPAGTFYIRWLAPANKVNSHITRLYDVTNTATIEYGTVGRDDAGAYASNNTSVGYAKVVIGGATEYRLEHRCETTQATNGFGEYINLTGVDIKYSVVEIEQTA